jgi:hypothetical protein
MFKANELIPDAEVPEGLEADIVIYPEKQDAYNEWTE